MHKFVGRKSWQKVEAIPTANKAGNFEGGCSLITDQFDGLCDDVRPVIAEAVGLSFLKRKVA